MRRERRRSARIFPSVWHVGAVRDLVGLVGHPAEVGAAAGARLAPAPVDREVIADLRGRRPPLRRRSTSRASVRIAWSPRDQALAFLRVELAEHRVRRELRVVERVVRSNRGRRRPPSAGPGGSCARAARPRSRGRASRPPPRGPRGRAPPADPSSPAASDQTPAFRSFPNSFTSSDGRSANRNLATDPRASSTSVAPRRRAARPGRGAPGSDRRRRRGGSGTSRACRRPRANGPRGRRDAA